MCPTMHLPVHWQRRHWHISRDATYPGNAKETMLRARNPRSNQLSILRCIPHAGMPVSCRIPLPGPGQWAYELKFPIFQLNIQRCLIAVTPTKSYLWSHVVPFTGSCRVSSCAPMASAAGKLQKGGSHGDSTSRKSRPASAADSRTTPLSIPGAGEMEGDGACTLEFRLCALE
jgi:hypothetical protein